MTVVDEYVVAGTGSRSLQTAPIDVKRAAADLVTARLTDLHAERGDYLIVMSGMALGFDKLLAVTAIKLGIPLWCAIPNRSYGHYHWRQHSVTGHDEHAEWARITSHAHRITHVMEDVHGTGGLYLNGVHSNFVRNQFMVDTADQFLVWDPTSRGTAHCLAAIKRAGKPYEILSPEPATLPI